MVPRGPKDYLKLGDQNAICDVCGFKYKMSELKERWDNLLVCEFDFETRQPLDFQKIPRPETSPEDTRSPPTDVFVSVTYADLGLEDDIPDGTFNNGGASSPL
ncbi:MAG: hypothetical protein MN733_39405 [Nitrososphaera sp.]|nr:hypothetical protein [Nitrososphaera sp.]